MLSTKTPGRHNGIVTAVDLADLAGFYDEHAHAISFYFSLVTTPDNSHREEFIAIKRLIQQAVNNSAPLHVPASLAQDLEQILSTADEISLAPARLKVVFACREREMWEEFDIPAHRSISILDVGRRFRLAPLMAASQACAPFCVVILESGKARGFVVRGTDIREITGRLSVEDLSLHAEDSRVGWSRHVEKNVEAHEKAYFKRLSNQVREFILEQQAEHLVIGCREDLWGEVGSQFTNLQNELIGHFHLTNFAVTPAEVLPMAQPLLEDTQRRRCVNLLNEINDSPSRAALGLADVLRALRDGRVQKLVVGALPKQTISECQDCRRIWCEAGNNCVFCGSDRVRYIAAEEGLIRQALATDSEILLVEEDVIPGFDGAAALLRY
jgi:release factor family 10